METTTADTVTVVVEVVVVPVVAHAVGVKVYLQIFFPTVPLAPYLSSIEYPSALSRFFFFTIICYGISHQTNSLDFSKFDQSETSIVGEQKN